MLSLVLSPNYEARASLTKEAGLANRIGVDEARQKVVSGDALLVCAYDDRSCSGKMLEGAILSSELEKRLPGLSRETEIIFYCG